MKPLTAVGGIDTIIGIVVGVIAMIGIWLFYEAYRRSSNGISAGGDNPPRRQRRGDAGYDIYAPYDLTVMPGRIVSVDIGFGLTLPKGYWALVQERSSMAKRGLFTMGNVVDEGYTGNVHVILCNIGSDAVEIVQGERFAQVVPIPRYVDPDEKTLPERGSGGFGST